MSIFRRLTTLRFSHRTVPFALLTLCLVAFGIFIPWMGFYWDDWPAVWFIHASGPEVLRRLEFHRPLSGWFLSLAAQFLGIVPINWQILNFVLRWLSALSLWWLARKLWPQRAEKAVWLALFFLVYPGFGQQFVSINSSRHILGLILFLLSLGTMLSAVRRNARSWPLIALSLLLSLAAMLTTEYYYGLELLRPFFLYAVLEKRAHRAVAVLKRWAPYLALLLGIFAWRVVVSQYGNYPLRAIAALSSNPMLALLSYARIISTDILEVSLVAWARVFSFPSPYDYGMRTVLYYLLLFLASGVGLFVYLRNYEVNREGHVWGKQAAGLGALALLLGGASFWAAGVLIKLEFPADRGTLPMMLGATLLMVGLADWLIRPRRLKLGVLSLLLALSVGYHFQNALAYRIDWQSTKSALTQLAWRVPGLKDGTLLLSEELPLRYVSDNSLTAPVNWMYAPRFSPDLSLDRWYFDNISRPTGGVGRPDDAALPRMPFLLVYLDLRLGTLLPVLEEDVSISQPYRYYRYQGSTDNAIVIYHQEPYCLRVLHPRYDRQHPHFLPRSFYKANPHLVDSVFSMKFPNFPDLTADALFLSNLDQIELPPDPPATLPPEIFGPPLDHDWCYYVQKADLARQFADWERVAVLGDEALASYESPRHASELVPFIQGYAHLGRREEARALTRQALQQDPAMQPMLCDIWSLLAAEIPEEGSSINVMLEELVCSPP